MSGKPIGAGRSSFDLIDEKKMFSEMGLGKNTRFMDVACGSGAYSIAAAGYIGERGVIYAVDLWEEGIAALEREIEARKIPNIHARVADISKRLPVEDGSMDVCLLSTVLHDLIQDRTDAATLQEVSRILKPQGLLAINEFKKIQGPPGPPVAIRLSPGDVEKRLHAHAFRPVNTVDIGPYNYLSTFTLQSGK